MGFRSYVKLQLADQKKILQLIWEERNKCYRKICLFLHLKSSDLDTEAYCILHTDVTFFKRGPRLNKMIDKEIFFLFVVDITTSGFMHFDYLKN